MTNTVEGGRFLPRSTVRGGTDLSIEDDLAKVTLGWTVGTVERTYTADRQGEASLARESMTLARHGYVASRRHVINDGDRHVNAGRSLAKGILTGGLGLLVLGRSRSKGKNLIEIWFERSSAHAGASIAQGDPATMEPILVDPDQAADAFEASRRSLLASALGRAANEPQLAITDVALDILPPFPPGHFEVSGSIHNRGTENLEQVEIEAVVLRTVVAPEALRAVLPAVMGGSQRAFRLVYPASQYEITNQDRCDAGVKVRRVMREGVWQMLDEAIPDKETASPAQSGPEFSRDVGRPGNEERALGSQQGAVGFTRPRGPQEDADGGENTRVEVPDALLTSAIDLLSGQERVSTDYLQRQLKINYPRAARLIDQMEARGLIGPRDGTGWRTVTSPFVGGGQRPD